jgi:hypothetical protein
MRTQVDAKIQAAEIEARGHRSKLWRGGLKRIWRYAQKRRKISMGARRSDPNRENRYLRWLENQREESDSERKSKSNTTRRIDLRSSSAQQKAKQFLY